MKKYLPVFLFMISTAISVFPSDFEIRVGIVAPVTGDAAEFGRSVYNGISLYLDRINESGGVDGMTIRYLLRDDKGNPWTGAEAFTKLIAEDRVSVIIGTVMSSVSIAGAPIAQGKGIPMVSPTSTNPAVTMVGNCIFRACFIDPYQGNVAAWYAINHLKARTAACLFDTGDDFTKGLARTFRERFEGAGGIITAFEGYPSGTMDWSGQLSRIAESDPDVLFLPDYYDDAGRIARQARGMGIRSQLIGGDGWDSPALFELGFDAIEGGVFVNHYSYDADNPLARDFAASYRRKYGSWPDALAALGYESAMIVVEAVRVAGSADPAAIREAMEDISFDSLLGPFRFDENRNPVKAAVILECVDGAAVYKTVVFPPGE